MKKLIYIFLLFAGVIYSQNCKYERNEIDEFTKKKILETKESYFSANFSNYTRAKAVKIDDKRYLSVFISLTSGVYSLNEDSKFMLLDDKENVITFKFSEFEISDPNFSRYGNSYTTKQYFYLSDDDFQRLKNSKIVKVRIYTSKGYTDMDVKDKYWKSVLKNLECIN